MRSDLPAGVARAIERAERPSLVFDLARIEANFVAIAAAARAHGVTALFAAKSFPHREIHALAARHLAGFDVASAGELAALPAAKILSIADPTGRTTARAERVIASCETVEQVRAAPAHAEIAIRISASITGRDPAVGAVLDGTGHRRSRFGAEGPAIGELVRAAAGRPVGIHIHHGPITATSPERFVASARAALAAIDLEPRFVNLGGAWHAMPDLDAALRELRVAVPCELIIEPGRAVTVEAGFACGRIVVARELADRALRVADLSRICHLRWSQIELCGSALDGRPTVIVGPTCFEDDVLGDWIVELAAGARVVFRHVSGYAVAWNQGFAGVPPADIVMA